MENRHQQRKIVATYDYRDERNMLLFQAVRFEPKDFRQRRPDSKGGWLWNLNGIRRVLYRLSNLLMAETVYIVEGEKDADRLWSLGIVATTNPQGAGKWRAEYNDGLRGKHVVIIPDNDKPGEHHAQAVARSLLAVAASVKIVHLPGFPPVRDNHGEDVSEWLDRGHTTDELTEIGKATPCLKAKDVRGEQQPQRNMLTLTKLSDLLTEPEEKTSWLVDKLLPTAGFSVLAAKPKAGKSTLARNLALSIAQGKGFLNKATQQGSVIYLALEEKRSEVKKHFTEMGATGEEEIYLFAASAPVDALQQIRVEAEKKKPVLIIIDPLFRFTRVKDGNDYAQMTAALEPVHALARETGAHVLCVHHAGKGEREGGDSILGSTAIFGSADTALFMKRSERYRTLSSIQRYGEDLPETVLRFDPQTRTVSLGQAKEQEESDRIAEAILACLRVQEDDKEKGHPLTQAEIDEEVEGKTIYKRKALKSLFDGKQIERTGKGGKKDPFRYCLKDSCFLVPYIYREHGNKNQKNGTTPEKDARYSCSPDSQKLTGPNKTREQQNPGNRSKEQSAANNLLKRPEVFK